MKLVVDASAVLAVCNQEPGMEIARTKMRYGLISAVNLSEVYASAIRYNRRSIAEAIIATAELKIVPFDEQLASITATLEAPVLVQR